MDRQWIVHIIDLPHADGVRRCVRCGEQFETRHIQMTPPGAMLAVLRDVVPVQWRPILERDDLMADEVSCLVSLMRD